MRVPQHYITQHNTKKKKKTSILRLWSVGVNTVLTERRKELAINQ